MWIKHTHVRTRVHVYDCAYRSNNVCDRDGERHDVSADRHRHSLRVTDDPSHQYPRARDGNEYITTADRDDGAETVTDAEAATDEHRRTDRNHTAR